MLELKGIRKVYHSEGEDVHALKGVDLSFRHSEFVAVLGPSGCGKTTLLNIIGGLDGFDGGDLVINGISTGKYKARDWDTYRNHSVGFVFQSYNLIPHQNVLSNVELSLTLTGVSKRERRRRAKEALEKVGLGDQMRKKPSAMSGGQCQRVAIARAIVNNPDIVLADEPTGALDTETGIMVMEILKEISKDRLVIMVTHNPELAAKYATRTVSMLDGLITGDTNPIGEAELKDETEYARDVTAKRGKLRLPSMSWATSFSLSLKNLISKKNRTLLTSFAGSIGIIGIALIYAVSQGTTMFIDSVQEQTLSSYPITIEAQTIDMTSLLTLFMGKAESVGEHEDDAVYQKTMMYEMLNAMNTLEERKNDLKSFKAELEARRSDPEDPLSQALCGVQYTYNIPITVYTRSVDGRIFAADTQSIMLGLMNQYLGVDMTGMLDVSNSTLLGSSYTSMMNASTALWRELLPGNDGESVNPVTQSQFDIVSGRWPESYDEVVLFVDGHNEIDDMTLYALGLIPQSEIDAAMEATLSQSAVDYTARSWSYDEICSLTFAAVITSDCMVYDPVSGTCTDLRTTEEGLEKLYANATRLRVVGIAKPNPDSVVTMTSTYVGYTYRLTQYVMERAAASDAVKAQLANTERDIITGLPFKGTQCALTEEEKAAAFDEYVLTLDEAGRARVYDRLTGEAAVSFDSFAERIKAMSREELETLALEGAEQSGMPVSLVSSFLSAMDDEQLRTQIIEGSRQSFAEAETEPENGYTDAEKSEMLDMTLALATNEAKAQYYTTYIYATSNTTYEDNLITLGCIDTDSPASVNLYAASFEDKDALTAAIDEYNEGMDELKQIRYTDYVGIMMSSITTIINAITYVLIAFVAVSLIVSSIMIGVITLISVQERTKEIGILRAIGASKRNVSGMFNAETMIIGFASGVLGVTVTYLMCIPINIILHSLTGLEGLSAYLPPQVAAVLIAISTLLTLIAGLIPSGSAAKKDPVTALRTE